MKIAVVTNDGRSISAHFGRARHYLVLTIENGNVVQREMRDKTPCDHSHHGHHHDHAHHHDHDQPDHSSQSINLSLPTDDHADDEHGEKLAAISDCAAVLSRGMGHGMHRNLQRSGIRAVLTDIVPVDEAVQAFLSGQLQERPELVH